MNKNLKNLRKNWGGKKILILGFGQEGRDTLLFLRKLFPKKIIGVADQKNNLKIIQKDSKVKLYLGKDYLNAIKEYEVIIKSPGIAFNILPRLSWTKITSQTKIFFENCPSFIIGITGTKGKGTTASLVYQILKPFFKKTKKVKLVGNIGKPVLNLLFSTKQKDIFVYELSSHQLDHLKISPNISIFLNIYPEHLDYYKSFEEYFLAKANIILWQKNDDYLIYNSQDKIIKKIINNLKSKKGQIPKMIPIKGKGYQLNKEAAKTVANIFNLNQGFVEKAIKNYKPLDHRLEPLGTFKNIIFYNDSAATMPEATIIAIETLKDKLETIILGGSEKNLKFKKLAQTILKSKIKNIIFFPTTGQKIYDSIVRQNKQNKKFNYFFINKKTKNEYIKEAISLSIKHTSKNKISLFSPASASFNIFNNYKERGILFKKHLKNLKIKNDQ